MYKILKPELLIKTIKKLKIQRMPPISECSSCRLGEEYILHTSKVLEERRYLIIFRYLMK